jgi:hypothetical protein
MEEVTREYISEVTERLISGVKKSDEEKFDIPDKEVNLLSYALSPGPFELTDKKSKPSFWENFGNHFVEHEELAAGFRLINKFLPDSNAPDITQEIIPEGWNTLSVDNIVDTHERYWDYILNAQSPKDLEYRRKRVFDAMEHEERLAAGGGFSTFLGAASGAILSPSTFLFPLGKGPELAGVLGHVVYGTLKAAPKIAAQSFLHEAIVEGGKLESQVDQAVLNGLRDTAFGLAFYGAGRAIGLGTRAANIWKAREIVDHNYKGIRTLIHTDENKVYKGLIAEAIPGQIVSDADLAAAQAFLDNGAVLSGLSPFIGVINKIPYFGSPLLKGLTSTYGVTRKFFNRMANQSIVVGRIARGLPREVTVEEILDDITKHGRQTGFILQDLYVQSLGLKPGVVNNARAVIKGLQDGGMSSPDSFFAKVLKTIYSGEPSPIKEVNEAAKIWKEFSDPLYSKWLELNGGNGDILPPRTSVGYASRIMNQAELIRNPDGWRRTMIQEFTYQDNLIKGYKDPIQNLKTFIATMEERLPNTKGKSRKILQNELDNARAQLGKLRSELLTKIESREIPGYLLEDHLTKIRDRDPEAMFRPVYLSETAMAEHADNARNAYLSMTPEQITQEMTGFLSGGTVTNPTLARTFMVRDLTLLENGFLSTNMPAMVDLYAKNLGKKIALKQVFTEADWRNGVSDIVKELTAEKASRIERIEAEFPTRTKARDAKIDKIEKEFNENKNLIENGYNYFIGNNGAHPDRIKFGRAARNLTAISMLKRVPLLQGVDAIAMAYKQGLWPTITGGLLPLFRRIGSDTARAEFREGATHARVGLEMGMQRLSNSLYEGTVSEVGGAWSTFLQKSSNFSSVINGTNLITNSLQDISAGITQSRVMADLLAHSRGKLNKAGIDRLLMNGINPADADKFIAAYKGAKGYKAFGGHVSNWWLWEDAGLQSQMRRAIQNDITGSILKPGVFDKPFWTRDPILGLPAQFLGYNYAAFNKFLLPLFQQPDGSRVAAYGMMLYYGAWIEPFRKWSKGEEFEVEDEKAWDQWFWQAASDSGVLGYHVDLLNTATALLDPPFLDRWKTDKFRRRSFLGVAGGPIGGYMQNVIDVGQMFMDGKYSQAGIVKLANVLPVSLSLIPDYILREGLKKTDLPETRKDADYYSWVDRD